MRILSNQAMLLKSCTFKEARRSLVNDVKAADKNVDTKGDELFSELICLLCLAWYAPSWNYHKSDM
jgi:hypothetical protein